MEGKLREKQIIPSLEECVYTSCFCEENVWMLCEHVKKTRSEELKDYYVVFISNPDQTIPLWCQRASKDKYSGIVVWDYHVVVLATQNHCSQVFDLDTTLPFPCDFNEYTKKTFKTNTMLKPQYYRMFRVIPALMYLQFFASDRSHMKNDTGEWLKPPPEYPCIQTACATNNLSEFISMDSSVGIGDILTLDQFLSRFINKTVSSS